MLLLPVIHLPSSAPARAAATARARRGQRARPIELRDFAERVGAQISTPVAEAQPQSG